MRDTTHWPTINLSQLMQNRNKNKLLVLANGDMHFEVFFSLKQDAGLKMFTYYKIGSHSACCHKQDDTVLPTANFGLLVSNMLLY